VSARLADLADTLDVTPAAVVEAADRAGIEPLVDTSEPKGRSRNAEERPTDPELRCLAFPREDFRRLAAVVGAEEALDEEALDGEALDGEAVPA
jgi:hypothetical protein